MFLAPLFLIGLLAAGIPVIIHLRRSTRSKRIVFSTTRFFDAQFIQSSRRARFQDQLLMFLRILLFALFVLALAQPVLRLPGIDAVAGTRRNVVIVIDDSASMSMLTPEGPLIDQAKQGALSVVNSLSGVRGDRVDIILAGRREDGPRSLFPEPTNDLAAARREIANIHATDLATDLNSAVERAGEILGTRHAVFDAGATAPAPTSGSREVVVLSDMQRSSVTTSDKLSPGQGASLVLVSCAASSSLLRDDISVDAIQYGAAQPMISVPFSFRALVTNHSDQPRSVTASLVVDGAVVGTRPLDLGPNRSMVARFSHRFITPGWVGGHVEIGPPAQDPAQPAKPFVDTRAFDNRRYFTLHVQDHIHLLAIGNAPTGVPMNDELFFLRLALTVNPDGGTAPGPKSGARAPITIDTLQPAQLSPDKLKDIPLVVLANVPTLDAATVGMLEHYVDGGGNLLITLGDKIDATTYNQWAEGTRLHGGILPAHLGAATVDENNPGSMGFVSDEHPALAGLADPQAGNLGGVRVTGRYALEQPTGEVVMRLADESPLLIEKRFGRGRVVLFGTSLNRRWTNFPLQPIFLPWSYRLVSYLADAGLDSAGFVRTGQTVQLPTSATNVESLLVKQPDGTTGYPEPSRNQTTGSTAGSGMEFPNVETAGIYAVRSSAASPDAPPRLLFAANIPSDESDSATLSESDFKPQIAEGVPWVYASGPDGATTAAQKAREGVGIWEQLLILALLVGLFEPWLANRLSKNNQPAVDALSQRTTAGAGTGING